MNAFSHSLTSYETANYVYVGDSQSPKLIQTSAKLNDEQGLATNFYPTSLF